MYGERRERIKPEGSERITLCLGAGSLFSFSRFLLSPVTSRSVALFVLAV